MGMKLSDLTLQAAQTLSDAVDALNFAPPTTHIYNPLSYAWTAHKSYVEQYANSNKRVLFMGMNPGPFGMAQCGVPFGEIDAVRDWLGIYELIGKPKNEHPKRVIDGFACSRSEVSGRRFWGLFAERYDSAQTFFADHFVVNYCPLVFMEASGRNRTPDKLPANEVGPLYAHCDKHLRELVEVLGPEWVIGVGAFAENRAKFALKDYNLKFGRILHPSPASPVANRGWSKQATKQLEVLGIW